MRHSLTKTRFLSLSPHTNTYLPTAREFSTRAVVIVAREAKAVENPFYPLIFARSPNGDVCFCGVLQCVTVYYSVLPCVTICCSVLQCVAVLPAALTAMHVSSGWCNVLQYIFSAWRNVLQCVAVHCSALQRVAGCCSMLHRVAVCCSLSQ